MYTLKYAGEVSHRVDDHLYGDLGLDSCPRTTSRYTQLRRLLTFSESELSLVSRDTISTTVAEAIAFASREIQDQTTSKIEAGWKHLDNLLYSKTNFAEM